MKILKRVSLAIAIGMLGSGAQQVAAQGMHFSQYYNAPMLQNPANTGLMSEKDFRIGVNYRDQWANVPAPFKTFSAYADFQAVRNEDFTNWLGLGLAVFNDKAGNGDLSLTRVEGSVAYHITMSQVSMLSGGISFGYAQRSLNFDKLTYGVQWDGFGFDLSKFNGERNGVVKTNYMAIGAGVNYAYFPSEFIYVKIGGGVAHLNQPVESFYGNNASVQTNKLAMRPTANADVLIQVNDVFTVNPSLYYTSQRKSSEIIAGSLGMFYLGGPKEKPTQLIAGLFYRYNDAAIAAFGLQWGGMKFMTSFDYTVSTLAAENKGNGAFEMSLIYQGVYGDMSGSRRTLNCPRF